MQPNIGELIFELSTPLVATYFLLGLFLDARWLRPNWDVFFCRVVPFSYFSRLVWLAFCGIFRSVWVLPAFHCQIRALNSYGIPLLAAFIVFMIFCRIRDGRRFKIERWSRHLTVNFCGLLGN